MKRTLAVWMMVLAMTVSLGCATVKLPPPAGCEGSWMLANPIICDLLLSSAVTALHAMAATKPAYYTLASASAKQAAALLREKPVSLADFQLNTYLTAFAPLFGLLPVDRVLCLDERLYLAAYFEMI